MVIVSMLKNHRKVGKTEYPYAVKACRKALSKIIEIRKIISLLSFLII